MPNENLKVICVISQKGGVGKSTLAAALASYLEFKDQRVLVLDADMQGSLKSWQEQCHDAGLWADGIRVLAPETAQQASDAIDVCYDENTADVVLIDTAGVASKSTV